MREKSPLVWIILILVYSNVALSQIKAVKETCLTDNQFDDRYASYAPDGKKIIFESNRDGNWEIYMMDSDGSKQERLTMNEFSDRRPSWHPEGQHILFESDESGKNELYTLDLKSRKREKISNIELSGELIFAQFSPNGEFIATGLSETSDKSNILLLNNKGELVKQLTNGTKRSTYPKWSMDGKEIVYFSRKETNNEDDEIYTFNLETEEDNRLTNWPKHNFCPSWSNDGKKIVYVTSMDDVRPEIYIMNSNGENPTRITFNNDGDTLPNWSPIENKIIITGYRNGSFQICEITLTR